MIKSDPTNIGILPISGRPFIRTTTKRDIGHAIWDPFFENTGLYYKETGFYDINLK